MVVSHRGESDPDEPSRAVGRRSPQRCEPAVFPDHSLADTFALMNHDEAQRWLDAYVSAWRANQPEAIRALFAPDVAYRYHPYDEPVTGIDALVDSWLESPDEPESWEAAYSPFAVDGNRVVATGYSRYLASGDAPERIFHNCFLLEFDDAGRCATFTEFYDRQP
jgi:hypothetical protein